MSIISKNVFNTLTDAGVEIFFVSGAATQWWNARRNTRDDIALLGGWYWVYSGQEAGPFRTPSAARRDVFYRRILKVSPPIMNQRDVARAQQEIEDVRLRKLFEATKTPTHRSPARRYGRSGARK